MLLIVTHSGDEHVPLVTKYLQGDHAVLHTDDIGCGTSITIDSDRCAFHLPLREVDSGEVDVVWYRRATINPGWSYSSSDALLDQYIHHQRTAMLDNAMSALGSEVLWLSEPWAVRRANMKTLQLRTALQVGLNVARYVVSDDPTSIRKSLLRGPLITKMISPGTPVTRQAEDQYVVFTNRISLAETSDDQLRAAPAIYQQEVVKTREARAIVVGNSVLTCGFETWKSAATELDWRHYDFDNVPHEAIELPNDVNKSLLAYTKALGLNFLAADLAQTSDGSWIFFEGNPNGQWGWLDEMADIGVAREIAAFLECRANRPTSGSSTWPRPRGSESVSA